MTLRQKRAIVELIRGPTVEAAARAANVGYSTLRRWLKEDDEFRQEYRAAVSELIEDATLQARQSLAPALSALREIVEDGEYPAAVRVQASRSLLEYGLKFTERSDIMGRMDEIEVLLKEAETRK